MSRLVPEVPHIPHPESRLLQPAFSLLLLLAVSSKAATHELSKFDDIVLAL